MRTHVCYGTFARAQNCYGAQVEFSYLITLLGLAVSSFIATNLDNLLLLVVLQGSNAGQPLPVLAGYLGAALLVVLVSALGVAIGQVLDAGMVGYLGLVPLLLGLRMLYQAWRAGGHPEEGVDDLAGRGAAGIFAGTLMLMLGNSGDSLAILLPLLAETGRSGQWVLGGSYLVAALLWAGLARKIAGQRALALRIERRGEKIVPWIMIGVGLYILLDTATDTLA